MTAHLSDLTGSFCAKRFDTTRPMEASVAEDWRRRLDFRQRLRFSRQIRFVEVEEDDERLDWRRWWRRRRLLAETIGDVHPYPAEIELVAVLTVFSDGIIAFGAEIGVTILDPRFPIRC